MLFRSEEESGGCAHQLGEHDDERQDARRLAGDVTPPRLAALLSEALFAGWIDERDE